MTPPSTRDRLRAAAAERFGRRGYEGTSMADLAKRVGVTKATLYSHYPSKEALLLELFEEAIADWSHSGREALQGEAPLLERLHRHLELALAWTTANPHRAAIVQVAATRLGGELGRGLQQRLDQLADAWTAEVSRAFADAAERGELATRDVPSLIELWRAVADGLLSVAVLRPHVEPPPLDRLAVLWPALERGFAHPHPRERSTP